MQKFYRKQKGYTLIEYMVSIVIGLILLAGFSYLFVGMKLSFNTQGSIAKLQENGRFALYYLTNDIQNAGWADVPTKGYGNYTLPYLVEATTLDGGAVNASDRINIRYESPNDCLGNSTAGVSGIASNQYYVENNSLMCQGVGATPQPIINDVEALHFLYGVDTDNDSAPNKFVKANELGTEEYAQVSAVKVMLLLRSDGDLHTTATAQSFRIGGETDAFTADDRKIRKLFSSTINIPNKSPFGAN